MDGCPQMEEELALTLSRINLSCNCMVAAGAPADMVAVSSFPYMYTQQQRLLQQLHRVTGACLSSTLTRV